MERKTFTLGFFAFLSLIHFGAFAQMQVSGTVTDDVGEALIAASLTYYDGEVRQGTVTDINGRFELELPSQVDFVELSYIGYETRIFSARELQQPDLAIALIPGVIEMTELVITDLRGVCRSHGCCCCGTIRTVAIDYRRDDLNTDYGNLLQSRVQRQAEIRTFPNPTSDMLQITLDQDCPLKLVSLSGQIVLETQGLKGQNEINLVDLASGQYRLLWQKEDGSWESDVVVKE